MHTTSLIPLSFLFHVYFVFAVKFPFEARSVKRTGRLQGRATISGQAIANTHNSEYISNITLGGQTIAVMLDTGRYVEGICISEIISHTRTAPICGSLGLSQGLRILGRL